MRMIEMRFTTDPDRRALLAGMAAFTAAASGAIAARAQDEGQGGDQNEGVAPPVENLVQGDPDAPVTMIEYVSLTCPHCASFHVGAYQDLKRDYIDTGKVKLEVREVFFDREGLWGAMLARCGGEAKYFGFVDLLLRKQKEWARAESVAGELYKIGRLGGLTREEMDACLRDDDFARALVEKYQSYRNDPLFEGTPTLVLDGVKVDHTDYAAITAAIEDEL